MQKCLDKMMRRQRNKIRYSNQYGSLPTKYQVEKRNGLDLWIEIQINCFYHGFLILVVYNKKSFSPNHASLQIERIGVKEFVFAYDDRSSTITLLI
jgi:hypothetical protein